MKIVVVKTGIANTASVCAALSRAGAEPLLTDDLAEIQSAERLMLPGVGAFGAAVSMLKENGSFSVIKERILEGKPTIAICLGFQLLAKSSEETSGVEGLGILPIDVKRFGADVRAPQFGWNKLVTDDECRLLEDGYAYFANSYRIPELPMNCGWAQARSEHGGSFVAAIEKGAVLACQFHPELSGSWGANLISRWLELTKG